MAKNASFRQLIAWQKGMNLVETCYGAVAGFPRSEEFVLSAQMRRAAISIPSNIAEGQRLSRTAFHNYLRTALASEAELETQVELAARLGFLHRAQADAAVQQAEEVARLVRGLMNSLGR